METLYRLGGKAYSREIRVTMESLVAPMLGKADYGLVSNAQPRELSPNLGDGRDQAAAI